MKRFAAFLVAGLLATSPALAQSDADRARAQAAIAQLIADTAAVDIEGISSVTPPTMLETLATMAGQDPAEAAAAMQTQIRDLMQQVNIESYEIDLAAGSGGVTATGRPYFVVPSRMTMEVIGAGRVLGTSDILAFEDEEQWWLVRMDSPLSAIIVRRAFPDLTGIDFAPATTEEIQ